jgi:hypothetical protein
MSFVFDRKLSEDEIEALSDEEFEAYLVWLEERKRRIINSALEQIRESEELRRRADEQMKSTAAVFAETKAQFAETKAQFAETDRMLENLTRRVENFEGMIQALV